MKSILIASENIDAVSAIQACLGSDYELEVVSDRESCLAKFMEKRHEFLFIDLSFLTSPDQTELIDYNKALEPFWNEFPVAQIIVMSSQEDIRKAVKVVKAGASDYLTYPIKAEEVGLMIDTAHESVLMQSELDYLRDEFWKSEEVEVVNTLSLKMKKVFDKVKSVAPTKTTVLLTGETGTGKGVLARVIHLHSTRSDNQFINVHCGAIPDTLIESELFGHEKGAFTGAIKRKLGKFEIAQGGTIFLDEIGTVTPSVQIKLLQVLQENIFQRVGGEGDIEADVRVIAASNEDLQTLIEEGSFRKDLYYRLNVFPIEVPPLKDRIEDIPFLVQGFLENLDKYYSKGIQSVHSQVMEAFRSYDWPGNIRELENIIERAYIIEESTTLTPETFPAELFSESGSKVYIPVDKSLTLAEVKKAAMENAEQQYLREILAEHKGRIDATAAAARITTRQLRNLLKKYEINKNEFKATGKNK